MTARPLTTLALLLAGAVSATAQTPYLVRDIETAADLSASTSPRSLDVLDGSIYFVGSDDTGRGLRRLEPDGTVARVRDLAADEVTVTSGVVYVSSGTALWRSDGTFAGTGPVRTFASAPGELTDGGGQLYFVADDQLWKSDGTFAGTVALGPGGFALRAAAGRVFYLRNDPATGTEPWTSDGTAAGTQLLRDVCPGTCSGASSQRPLVVSGSTLYFEGREPATGFELWKSDGTPAGTALVADVEPGTGSGFAPHAAALPSGGLVFAAANGLWRTDGTPAGTALVRPLLVFGMLRSGAAVYVNAFDAASGWELWKTDGTAAGTVLVADACPGACSLLDSNTRFGAAPFGVVFTVWTGSQHEIWSSDGSAAGTRRIIQDVRVLEYGPATDPLRFAGLDAVNGEELWTTDGSAAGTRLATSRVHNSGLWAPGVGPKTAVGDRLFLTAQRADVGHELWTSQGSALTTQPIDLTPGTPGTDVFDTVALGDVLLFDGIVNGGPRGLWRSDGGIAGSSLVQTAQIQGPVAAVGSLAFFSAISIASGYEPWRTDGTTAGTFQLAEVAAGTASSVPKDFTGFQGAAYFIALDESSVPGLWRTNGTTAGTARVVPRSCPSILGATGQQIFLSCFDTATGLELWRSDGTAAGTRLVKDANPGPLHTNIVRGATAGDLLFFSTVGALWRSDGTDAGTVPLHQLLQIPVLNQPDRLIASGGVLYFGANTPETGLELWRSDGTAAGTFLLRDLVPGPESGLTPDPLADTIVAVDGGVVFAAYTPERGVELWKSDGTAAGTLPLPDIAPGPASSFPSELVRAGGAVYARATDGVTGYELWAVPLTTPTVTVGDVAVTERDAGTHDAVFTVRLLSPPTTTAVVQYATGAMSAQSGSDYVPRNGTLTFTPGTSALEVAVPIVGDLADEPQETFALALAANPPVVLARLWATGTIADDDGPRVASAGTSVVEGNAGTVGAAFALTLTTKDGTPTPEAKTVAYATASVTATAGADFVPASGSVTFPAGTTSGAGATVTVSVNGDTVDEPDETFTLALAATGDVGVGTASLGVIRDDDGLAAAPPVEIASGTRLRADLAPPAGRTTDRDDYVLLQQPNASYEVAIDEASGLAAPLTFVRVAPDGTTVLQSATAVGTGSALGLRWQNTASVAIADQHLSVSSAGCGTSCGADDTYRLRAYETTLFAPRFNNVGGQGTVVVLQNTTDAAIAGRLLLWLPSGALGRAEPFTVPARGVRAINTLALLAASGTITVTHDGPYGGLAGKAVSLEPATGFSFDTPLVPRPR